MKFSKTQREQHQGAARELIERLERRLCDHPPSKTHLGETLLERVDVCKQQLGSSGLRDRELLKLNLELADIFYRSNNADKRRRSLH